MFFKEYFKSVADIVEAKYKGHMTLNQNNADKGELCEIFIKDFLIETLGDSFKIARGGKIIDHTGIYSRQLDIVLQAKKSLKLFYDKGIYPTETIFGVISVTSTLDKAKALDCCDEFISIPRQNFQFITEGYVNDEYIEQTKTTWVNMLPFKVVFAYSGTLQENWIPEIIEKANATHNPVNAVPDLIIVNKKGFIEKSYYVEEQVLKCKLKYVPFNADYNNYGVPYSKMVYHLNNMAHEEIIMKPALEYYFNQDI